MLWALSFAIAATPSLAQSGRSSTYTSVTTRNANSTAELVDDPATTDALAAAASETAWNATAQNASFRSVTTTATETSIDAASSTRAAEPTTATLTVPGPGWCLVLTSADALVISTTAYTTMTVVRAPALPKDLNTGTTTSSTLAVVTRPATSNRGTLNASVPTPLLYRNATATIQHFSGDATVMSLSFPFVVSVIGIVLAGVWFL
ncbi:hypothetical protein GP486_006836 [Trichoglossum hirsutum]|uniref:Uncharacterized protein n=1 Tax=Trichoglossum hirsutum TaxID=265104 RepID=A0A9P8IGQ5_9PEZI|nr:hypothetical protein GP486_006836 [Trichoglossum hirsutum]